MLGSGRNVGNGLNGPAGSRIGDAATAERHPWNRMAAAVGITVEPGLTCTAESADLDADTLPHPAREQNHFIPIPSSTPSQNTPACEKQKDPRST